jgi:hypothetical protein
MLAKQPQGSTKKEGQPIAELPKVCTGFILPKYAIKTLCMHALSSNFSTF